MKIVYVAGPYRPYTDAQGLTHTREENIRQAEAYARALARAGIGFLCPHMNSRDFDGEAPDRFYLDMDLELIKRMRPDAMLMLPGWPFSSGTKDERHYANLTRIPVVMATGTPDDTAKALAYLFDQQAKSKHGDTERTEEGGG